MRESAIHVMNRMRLDVDVSKACCSESDFAINGSNTLPETSRENHPILRSVKENQARTNYFFPFLSIRISIVFHVIYLYIPWYLYHWFRQIPIKSMSTKNILCEFVVIDCITGGSVGQIEANKCVSKLMSNNCNRVFVEQSQWQHRQAKQMRWRRRRRISEIDSRVDWLQ